MSHLRVTKKKLTRASPQTTGISTVTGKSRMLCWRQNKTELPQQWNGRDDASFGDRNQVLSQILPPFYFRAPCAGHSYKYPRIFDTLFGLLHYLSSQTSAREKRYVPRLTINALNPISTPKLMSHPNGPRTSVIEPERHQRSSSTP